MSPMRYRQWAQAVLGYLHDWSPMRDPIAQNERSAGKQHIPTAENMANHKSAIKRIRQNEKRRLHNRSYRNRARTLVKKARDAMDSGDLQQARDATYAAMRDLDKLASRGVVHKRNAARRKSRLMKQLNALEA